MTLRHQQIEPETSSTKKALMWLGGCLLLATALFFLTSEDTTAKSTNSSAALQPAHTTAAIKDVKLGQRTLGKNPERDGVEKNLPEIVASEWRELHLELIKETGDLLTVHLLRPHDWLQDQSAAVGKTIYLDLAELGAEGDAKITYIGSCPEIAQGEGNVVTGKFIHQSTGNLVNLTLEGQQKPTGVTNNHPYWSVDRKIFVEAGDLKPGETLQTFIGTTRVVSIAPRSLDEAVYNLEIQGEHVYRVGALGVLVHNTYPTSVPKGTKVTRNWGGNSGPNGNSWTREPVSKQSRNLLGLGHSNTGEFVSHGRIVNNRGVTTRRALEWDGFLGGGDEVLVPDSATQIILDAVTMPDIPLP